MQFQCCFNASEDKFPLPPNLKQLYGPFGFPEPRDARRPHTTSNFVMSLDGRAAFREIAGQAGGREMTAVHGAGPARTSVLTDPGVLAPADPGDPLVAAVEQVGGGQVDPGGTT